MDPAIDSTIIDVDTQAANCERLDQFVEQLNEDRSKSRSEAPTADGESGNPSPVAESPADSQAPVVSRRGGVVGEPDFVRVSGSNLLILKGGEGGATVLHSFLIDSEGLLSEVDSISLPGSPEEFLLEGDKILVITRGEKGLILSRLESSPGTLSLKDSISFGDSQYVTSRLFSGTAHLVMTQPFSIYKKEISPEELIPTYSRINEENGDSDKVKVGSCGTTFIPDDGKDTQEKKGSTTSAMTMIPDRTFHQVVSILSLPLGGDLSGTTSFSVISGMTSPIVSFGETAIYVGEESWRSEKSQILKFSLERDGRGVSYSARGEVPGRLETAYAGGGYNSQFSMDEYRGDLRVATTLGGLSRIGESSAESSVYVLRQEGQELKIVGELRDLHSGEAIYAVRFLGDRGYVVTFKKVDPLFVIDLSTPETPALVGELEVPGFSTYLTPLDRGRLLAVGKDADDQGSFAWFLGVKLSLFNVEDPANPFLIDSVTIGERGTESEALSDRRALSLFPERGLLALPIDLVTEIPSEEDGWGWRSFGEVDHSEEQLWTIDLETGFRFVGAIRHDDLSDEGSYYGDSRLRRALEVEGNLVTISEAGIKVHRFDSLEEALSSFELPTFFEGWGEFVY